MVNVAARAFEGGVCVRLSEDCVVSAAWCRGKKLSDAIRAFGGTITDRISGEYPTVRLGNATKSSGKVVITPTWNGWAAGVSDEAADRLAEEKEFTLAGVLAGAFAVSEAFEHMAGNAVAARRSIGLSLWRPDLIWTAAEAEGIDCRFLPSRLWLLGLGHLGQSFAWSLGLLPYKHPSDAEIWVQDVDSIVEANWSTCLLSARGDAGKKTRLVATRLENVGFRTSVIERLFGDTSRRGSHEPGLALGGFDNPAPRRALGSVGFDAVIDAGLGTGGQHYADMMIHSFPSSLKPAEAWPTTSRQDTPIDISATAYQDAKRSLTASGLTEDQATCGVVELAGRSAAAAFVGAAASTLVLSEVLRIILGGPRFEVLSVSLRDPEYVSVSPNPIAVPDNLPFVPSADWMRW